MLKPEEIIFEGGNITQYGQSIKIKPFAMAIYPVTNEKYEQFDPNHERCDKSDQDNQPVVNVSWEDAVKYCQWLSKQTGEHYRLPTRDEWEFAANRDSQRIYPWGDEKPNHEGLFDMASHVQEWCDDWHYDDPPGRVIRGGLFNYILDNLRCVARYSWEFPYNRNSHLGFRVVRKVKKKKEEENG